MMYSFNVLDVAQGLIGTVRLNTVLRSTQSTQHIEKGGGELIYITCFHPLESP